MRGGHKQSLNHPWNKAERASINIWKGRLQHRIKNIEYDIIKEEEDKPKVNKCKVCKKNYCHRRNCFRCLNFELERLKNQLLKIGIV